MQKAAQQDESDATVVSEARYRLGLMYENGEGVEKNLTNAYEAFKKAAIMDFAHPDAQFRLGMMYENGDGVVQDHEQAAMLYCASAKNLGHGEHQHEAVNRLVAIYAQGKGVPTEIDKETLMNLGYDKLDPKQPGVGKELVAAELHDLQRWANSAKAYFSIGSIYYDAKLVPKNPVEASAWFHRAAEENLPEAVQKLEQIKPELSPEQETEVKNRLNAIKQ